MCGEYMYKDVYCSFIEIKSWKQLKYSVVDVMNKVNHLFHKYLLRVL